MKKVVLHKAFTLVELLVVLGIALLLAALILPSVKTLLADRKTSQSAIMVKNYLEAARARAIGKNRSVAVVLERISGRPWDRNEDGIINMADTVTIGAQQRFQSATAQNFDASTRASQSPDINFIPYNTCIKLSMAEEPLPITSKTVPALVSGPISFFQIGTDSLSLSIPHLHAAIASARWGVETETTTEGSPISRRPVRWAMATRASGHFSPISSAIFRICAVAISA